MGHFVEIFGSFVHTYLNTRFRYTIAFNCNDGITVINV